MKYYFITQKIQDGEHSYTLHHLTVSSEESPIQQIVDEYEGPAYNGDYREPKVHIKPISKIQYYFLSKFI